MERDPLNVAFVAPGDPHDPDAVSGMPHRMFELLLARGLNPVPIVPPSMIPPRRSVLRRAAAGLTPGPIKRALRGQRRTALPSPNPLPPGERVLGWARARAREIEPLLAAAAPDVIFGCCATALLYDVGARVPMVHFSDATARLLGDGYSMFRDMEPERRAAYDELERGTLARLAAAVYPSRWALDSAITDYGLSAERGHIVPMGATVMPDPGERFVADPPTREALRLCIVAGDPARKRVALAIEATRVLRAAGWNATLAHIGTPDPAAAGLPFVASLGRLRLSDARDRARHRTVLRESHFMILPSLAEAYGIAPCEAAHFGRPSIVSAAGGLPSIVIDGETGRVLPVDADGAAYASAIADIADDPGRYARLSAAALERARRVLNWDAWGDRVAEIIRAVAR